jgi:N-acetyl-anhydromuramyl-L-alanine amidase AmpD
MYEIEWIGSPHFTPHIRSETTPPRKVPLIVLHTMAGSLDGTAAHFNHPESLVSSHYGVDHHGEIHQYVHETDGAWTNGRILRPAAKQILERGANPNHYTITIEFAGQHRQGALDERQYQAGLWLIRQITKRWSIPCERDYIIGHGEIDSINKFHCPGLLFPWIRLMKDLRDQRRTIPIYHNGTLLTNGYLEESVTYAPLRQVLEGLRYTVQWNERKHSVEISSGTREKG